MSTSIQLRRNTSIYWATHDFIPKSGEPIAETDTGKIKIGDGINLYSILPYAGGSGSIGIEFGVLTKSYF